MRITLAACACLALLGCGAAVREPASIKVSHLPPTPKDVIDAVMANSQAVLTDSTCKGFGTESTDKTIGRYLAGYLSELSNQDARNAITTSVESQSEAGQAVYRCRLMVRHAQGEDVWSWGIQFFARQSDGTVLLNSVRCIGAG